MPAYVKTLAKKKGVPVVKAEEKWSRAKDAAAKQGQGENYGYITSIFKNMMHETGSTLALQLSSALHTAGLSAVLFHKTTIRQATLILKDAAFSLKPTEGTTAEEETSGAFYYLSTARSPTSDYITQALGSSSALMVLDGTKLSARYGGTPVDYWGNVPHTMGHDEMEDRVLSRTPRIPALPYVKEIHAVAWTENADAMARVSALHRAALHRRIPIYWYTEAKDLVTRSPSKRLEVKVGQLPRPKNYEPEMKSWTPLRKDSNILPWLALWKMPVPTTKAQQDAFYAQRSANRKLRMAYENIRYTDAVSTLNSDMHNAKGTDHGSFSKEREHLDELVKIMRTHRLTPKTFVEALRMKWYNR